MKTPTCPQTFHFFWAAETRRQEGNLIFWGHGNASLWNFTSGTVPRVKHYEPAHSQTDHSGGPEQPHSFLPSSSLRDPLWHSSVHILDIPPQNTSHIHTAQQASAPASQASAVHSHVSSIVTHSTTLQSHSYNAFIKVFFSDGNVHRGTVQKVIITHVLNSDSNQQLLAPFPVQKTQSVI